MAVLMKRATSLAIWLSLGGCSLVLSSSDYTGGLDAGRSDSGLLGCSSDGECPASSCNLDTHTCAPMDGCRCAIQELCIDGGRCVASGACVPEMTVPRCLSGFANGDVPAFRIFSAEGIGTSGPRVSDLHIVGSLVPMSSTDTTPGWSMLWRDSGGVVKTAFADATHNSRGDCYFGGSLNSLGTCTAGPAPAAFDHMDARTLYIGSSLSVNTAMVTSAGTDLELWSIHNTRGTDPHPTSLCVDHPFGMMMTRAATGVSLAASGPSATAFATLDAMTMTAVNRAGVVSATTVGLEGPVAGGYGLSLYSQASRERFSIWAQAPGSNTSGTYLVQPSRRKATSDPVAAIDPTSGSITGSPPETFAYARDMHQLEVVTCATAGLAPTCSRSSLLDAPLFVDRPISAYRRNNLVTLIALEDMGSSMELTARTSGNEVRQLLSDTVVGGHITDLLAVDAEGVAQSGVAGGWDYAWAAFVLVERSGGSSLELWTGAERHCP